jgi:hypothetical protein
LKSKVKDLENPVDALERDGSLFEPDRLRARIEALDHIDAWLSDCGATNGCAKPGSAQSFQRAGAFNARLESANKAIYRQLRKEIQRGCGAERLLRLAQLSSQEGREARAAQNEGYDDLDDLISGLLQFDVPEIENLALPREMVPYQPTPARHIFDLIGRTALNADDVLVDLGSGLGHVSILASICSDARSIGVELEAGYLRCARKCARALNLHAVKFVRRDVRKADFSSGTVFYLYTPFVGSILRTVLDHLQREARTRSFRICALGKCTPAIAAEPWLEALGEWRTDRIALFRTRR